jgi:hypothetical protein
MIKQYGTIQAIIILRVGPSQNSAFTSRTRLIPDPAMVLDGASNARSDHEEEEQGTTI